MDDPRASPLVLMPLVLGLAWIGGCGSSSIPERAVLRGHGGDVTSLAFTPDGKILASRSLDLTVRIWDVPQGRQRMGVPGFLSEMGCVAFSPDGLRLASNEASFGAVAWDSNSGDQQITYRTPVPSEPAMSCYAINYGWGIAYSPDGKTLAVGESHNGDDGFVTLWDIASGKADVVARRGGPVTSVAFSPGGDVVASAGLDGKIRLWDLATRSERACLRGPEGGLPTICYSPDGRTLASAGGDQVKLWNASNGEEIGSFAGHRANARSVAISRDGRIAASDDRDGEVLLWELSTRRTIARLARQEEAVLCLAFSPVDDLLATGGGDGMIRLWDLTRVPKAD